MVQRQTNTKLREMRFKNKIKNTMTNIEKEEKTKEGKGK